MAENSAVDEVSDEATGRAVDVIKQLGPGLITGAADDDPSGIATYSQAGAQFGPNMLWTVIVCLPMMIAIQSVAGRIGAVTGKGLAANIKQVFPRWLLTTLVVLLVVANTINIAADVAAMGSAAALVLPGIDFHIYVVAFAVISLLLQVFVAYHRYVSVLKWLTLALLAYVAVVFTVKIPWGEVGMRLVMPQFAINKDSLTMIVAILGTTISPYLFFWQSAQEVEEIEDADTENKVLRDDPVAARKGLRRIGIDTISGMVLSEAIAFFVILTTAVTLNVHHVTNIDSAAKAAEALKPIAGPFASIIFSLGILGTGLLAIPVLAGSAAYAVAETRGWKEGLSHKLLEAKEFYAIIVLAVLGGVALSFSPIDPIKALVLSAVVNGVVAVPIMAVTMLVAARKDLMGLCTATNLQRIFGWLATGVMGVAAVAMIVLMLV
jgi:NRAMP (natural resistance-associated macrophage protein)-like metal ion transporter